MAAICPKCGSADVQALVDKSQCLTCGTLVWPDGTVAPPGADEATRRNVAKALRPKAVNVVGNLADLQRAGGIGGPNSVGENALENLPQGLDAKTVQATEKTAEKVDAVVDDAVKAVDDLHAGKSSSGKA